MSREGGKRVRYAVVGAGNLVQVAVLPAFQNAGENSELGLIVSGNPEKRDVLGSRYGVATCSYDGLEAAIARERIDALYVAVPNTAHREFVERAARARVHVLCEKPMAVTSDDCRAMVAACETARVQLMVAYRLHFEEANLRAAEIVRSGRIGKPRYFSACFSQQVREGDIRTRSKTGGGALFDMGVYCINAARFLFEAEPLDVVGYQTRGADSRFREVDEMTAATLRFPGDRLAQFTASQGAADVDTLRVVGTRGDLRMEPAFGYASDLQHVLTVGGEREQRVFEKRDQFAPELVRFSEAILKGEPSASSGREGWADVRIMEAIERSACTGRHVTLEPFDPGERPELADELKKPAVQPPEATRAPSPNREAGHRTREPGHAS